MRRKAASKPTRGTGGAGQCLLLPELKVREAAGKVKEGVKEKGQELCLESATSVARLTRSIQEESIAERHGTGPPLLRMVKLRRRRMPPLRSSPRSP